MTQPGTPFTAQAKPGPHLKPAPPPEAPNGLIPLSAFSDEPLYNVKAVCMRTGITAATLRAWERRYGLPAPNRTQRGYRLYSDRDVALLFWLIQQTEQGLSIGQAVQQLANLMTSGAAIHVRLPSSPPAPNSAPRSPETLEREMVDAMTTMDERSLEQLINETLAIYTLETALTAVLRGALRRVEQGRRAGEQPITVERFAFNYCRQRLLSLIQATPTARDAQPIVTAGLPGEKTEIDLLMLGLLLRRHGFAVMHLGGELPPVMLNATLDEADVRLVVYIAERPGNAPLLADYRPPRTRQGETAPVFVVGNAFADDSQAVPAHVQYLGADFRGAFRELLGRLTASPVQP
jgi:DNA-binding transcriptional MerR regulator